MVQPDDVLLVGARFVNRTNPRVRMGVVKVLREWRPGDWEGEKLVPVAVVCQRIGIPFEEGACAPYPVADFLERYEPEKTSFGGRP
jgi:hypothetical protein